MDIASGLKKYMELKEIQISQFADTCGIPRPSLSQLLNGRNKKVSNEVIEKIHRAYPDLSVSWLMFGEGDMLTNGNIEISEPQNDSFKYDEPTLFTDYDSVSDKPSQFANEHENSSNKISAEKTISFPPVTPHSVQSQQSDGASSMSLNMSKSRKVVSIMVFYSDNSFETFVPKEEQLDTK